MLASCNRLTSSQDFRAAVRGGRRSGSGTLVVHWRSASAEDDPTAQPGPVRVGFVVSKAVGVAVVRNRVKRRLRHLVRERIEHLPAGGILVVRAQPAAATASYDVLGAELDRLLARSLGGASSSPGDQPHLKVHS